jgi:hypothetical protein
VSEFLRNTDYSSPHLAQISKRLLFITSVKDSNHQRTRFTHFYRLLSPPYDVPPYHSNRTCYNPSVVRILFSWNTLVCVEDNSGFILMSPCDDVFLYWVANLCKCCNWRGFAVEIGWVHKNVNQYVSFYLTLATELWIYSDYLEEPHDTHRSPLYQCAAVNHCSTEIYRKYYLIFSFQYVLLRSSRFQQCRPQWTERR